MSLPLPLAGRTVLVTGNIDGLTRDEAREAIATLGGTPAPGVSRKVDLIVLGEGAGVSKTAKARAFAIRALPGEVFASLAADPCGWDGQPLGITFAEYDTLDIGAEPDPIPTRVDPAHWVAKGVGYAPNPRTGLVERQVRFVCACGHRWMRHVLVGDDACPRPVEPVTVSPWAIITC